MDVESHPSHGDALHGIAAAEPEAEQPEFYVHKDGINYGPETAANLESLGAAGWLQPEDLVWKEGFPEWQAAGVVFASAFPFAAPLPEAEEFHLVPEHDSFFAASAVRLPHDAAWPWGSIGVALLGHALLLFLAVEWLQFHPLKFTSDTVPVSQEPPLEVMMVPEQAPVPPPPPPVDSTPPPVIPPPLAPPPVPMPEIPPPPAVAEMPVPVMPPPPLPISPPVSEPAAETPAPVAAPRPVHHKVVPRPQRVVTAPPPEPQETPPAAMDAGEPQYLYEPRPEYPVAARLRHQEGTVLLLVTLDAAGNPISVSVEQSSGSGVLDQAARKKVAAEWKFKPGQGSTVHVPVEFHLE